MECKECGAPVAPVRSALMTGVDYDGEEAVFEVVRVQCPAGHFYDEIGAIVK